MRATLTMNPLVINVQPGYFRVRLLWLRRSLDKLSDSTNLSDGLHTIHV